MDRRLAIAAALVLVACAEPPPATPASTATQQPASPQQQPQQPNEQYAAMQAQIADAQRQQLAAAQAQQAAIAAGLAKAEADQKAQLDARVEAARKQCAETRERRVQKARAAAKARVEFESIVKQRAREITAACKLLERPTGAVNVQKSGSGFRASREMQDDLACPGGVPKGFTKQQVYVVLWRVRESGSPVVDISEPILTDDDHDPDDRGCKPFDAEVALDLEVRHSDSEGLKRLLQWKPEGQ